MAAQGNVNDYIRDLQVRHTVGVQRLSTSILKGLLALLAESDAEIVAKLQARDPTLQGRFTSMRLRYLLKALRDINHDTHVELGRRLREELREFARYEAEFQQRLIYGALPVKLDVVSPSATILNAAVTAKPFDGVLLRDAVKRLEVGKQELLKKTISKGMIQGQTTDEIVRAVRGTQALNYKDGILNLNRTATDRLVRTATNHVANAAREALYAENTDLVAKVQWVATLDTRTCPTCMELDGKTFNVDEGPRPPRHLNCRCCTAPVTASWKSLGLDLDEAPPGTRASMNGQVSATETYQSWLKKQSAAVQDEALGPARGKLYRAGGLEVDRFTDTAGQALTLDQLRKRESAAFEAAGL